MAISDELRKQVDPNNESCCKHCLSNKCKEWALDNRWIISTMPMLTEKKWRNTSVRLSHFYSAGKDRYLDGIYHNGRIEADTETEAIFKACQWILDKDSK